MTRQEFETKNQKGTLTVGDILSNPEFATPEQVEAIADHKLLRAIRENGRPVTETLRYVAKMLNQQYNEVGEDLAVMGWEHLNTEEPQGEQ